MYASTVNWQPVITAIVVTFLPPISKRLPWRFGCPIGEPLQA
jgi:hypothetical protein